MFLDCFEGTCRNDEIDRFFQFGDIDFLFLEIGVFADHSRGVELRSTSAV